MPQRVFDLPDIGTVTFVKRRGNTNIRMSFARDGTVRVSLPYFVSYHAGVQFVLSKADWLSKHRPDKASVLTDGMRIGKAHRLALEAAKNGKDKATVSVRHNTVRVLCPVEQEHKHPDVQSAAKRGALRALKKEADQLLPQRLDQLASTHGFSYTSVATKRLSSRWGSCSQHKDIILNTYLMQVPWDLIDYVILHELVHTEHLNHSPGFWARFEQVLPDAKTRRKELKTYRTDIPAQ